jgi:hypothetical protein
VAVDLVCSVVEERGDAVQPTEPDRLRPGRALGGEQSERVSSVQSLFGNLVQQLDPDAAQVGDRCQVDRQGEQPTSADVAEATP